MAELSPFISGLSGPVSALLSHHLSSHSLLCSSNDETKSSETSSWVFSEINSKQLLGLAASRIRRSTRSINRSFPFRRMPSWGRMLLRPCEEACEVRGKTRGISGAHGVRQAKPGKFSVRMACASKTRQDFSAHGVREQNPASFRRAWRAGGKPGEFLARMACASKTRQDFSAHDVREENPARFQRAWRARAK